MTLAIAVPVIGKESIFSPFVFYTLAIYTFTTVAFFRTRVSDTHESFVEPSVNLLIQ